MLQEEFNNHFKELYAEDASRLAAEWRLFASTLEYGHDLEREAIDFQAVKLFPIKHSKMTEVRADRGWQPTGLLVEKGDRLRLTPGGRFTIAREPTAQGSPVGEAWPCEANGVTLDYHGGRPLGILLAAVGARGFVDPIVIGSGGEFVMPRDGALYLRVNDSPAKLSDNEGKLVVGILH